MLLGFVVCALFAVGIRAAAKEVTIKGQIMCAKCELKEGKSVKLSFGSKKTARRSLTTSTTKV
jgi:hypothetical protein